MDWDDVDFRKCMGEETRTRKIVWFVVVFD